MKRIHLELFLACMAMLGAVTFSMPLAAAQPTVPAFEQLNNGLAKTPPMGWNSWNNFGEHINEALILQTIDAVVASGMRDAGYQYVNLDDGWQRYKGNRSTHPLEADPKKFPRGIKFLADYAHARGLKLGLYSGPGEKTCAGYTGSLGHEVQDAALFGSWGVDYLKYDSCCSHEKASQLEVTQVFSVISKALLAQPQPIVLSACHCGWANVWQWAAGIGANQWRIGQDISDDFNYPGNRDQYFFDVLDLIDHGVGKESYSGPGHWNDFDMLIVGMNGKANHVGAGASDTEYRTHFSMWAMLASPLITGTDVRTMDATTRETLTNLEVIAINQDALGRQAVKVHDSGELEIFAKPLADGSWAVALLNRGSTTADMTLNWKRHLGLSWPKAVVRDLWLHNDMGTYDIPFTTEVRGHEARILRIIQSD